MGSFCKEFLCFDTMPRRPMPLLVHFLRGGSRAQASRLEQTRRQPALCEMASLVAESGVPPAGIRAT